MIVNNPQLQIVYNSTTTDALGQGQRNDVLKLITGLTNSTAAGGIDLVYVRGRTIASSGSPDSIDLNGGGLVGSDFTTANFAKITQIIFAHYDTSNTITVGGGSNAFATFMGGTAPTIKLFPAVSATIPSFFVWSCAASTVATVTAGTGDLIQVATSGGTNVPYLVLLLGRTV